MNSTLFKPTRQKRIQTMASWTRTEHVYLETSRQTVTIQSLIFYGQHCTCNWHTTISSVCVRVSVLVRSFRSLFCVLVHSNKWRWWNINLNRRFFCTTVMWKRNLINRFTISILVFRVPASSTIFEFVRKVCLSGSSLDKKYSKSQIVACKVSRFKSLWL
jgi:hypothetical protein